MAIIFFRALFCKNLTERHLLKGTHADNLQDLVETLRESQLFAGDGDQEVGTNGRPDLCPDSIGTAAIKSAETEVLFNPFKKKFYLPAGAI